MYRKFQIAFGDQTIGTSLKYGGEERHHNIQNLRYHGKMYKWVTHIFPVKNNGENIFLQKLDL